MLNQHVTCAIARCTWVDSNWLLNLDEIIQVYADTLCQLGQSHTCNALNCAAHEAHVVPFEDLVNLHRCIQGPGHHHIQNFSV